MHDKLASGDITQSQYDQWLAWHDQLQDKTAQVADLRQQKDLLIAEAKALGANIDNMDNAITKATEAKMEAGVEARIQQNTLKAKIDQIESGPANNQGLTIEERQEYTEFKEMLTEIENDLSGESEVLQEEIAIMLENAPDFILEALKNDPESSEVVIASLYKSHADEMESKEQVQEIAETTTEPRTENRVSLAFPSVGVGT